MNYTKIAIKTAQIILGTAVVGVVTLLLLGHFDRINTIKPYVVQSGSMEPALKLGSIVFSYPQKKYKQGDIITFAANGEKKNLVTHRIAQKLYPEGIDKEPTFKTKGDTNEDLDRWEIKGENIVGKVVFNVPYIGYAVDYAKKPQGFILLVIVPATIVIYEELKSLFIEAKKGLSKFKKFSKKAQASIPKPFFSFPSDDLSAYFPSFSKMRLSNDNVFPKVYVLIPIVGVFLFMVAFSAGYFFDIEKSIGNILGAANSFEENPLPSVTPTPSASPTPPVLAQGDVVINEINWGGANGDGNDEWIELKNTTSNSINLTNWVVENLGVGGPGANITIPAGTIVANGFFLISNNDKSGSKINIDSDFVTTSVSLVDGGEQLILKSNSAVTIDTANDTGAWFGGDNSTPKKSMERKNPPGDGTQAANWQTATSHTNMDAGGPTDEFASPGAENP